jgi:hypothetical protein
MRAPLLLLVAGLGALLAREAPPSAPPVTDGGSGAAGAGAPVGTAGTAAPSQGAAPVEATGTDTDLGAAYDTDSSLPAHAEDVVDYTLRARLDPIAHTIHGEGTIRWRNTTTAPVRELWVHLYLNAFKNERSAFLREPIGGFRGNEEVKDWGYIDVRTFALHLPDGGSSDLWSTAELYRPGDDDETDARVQLPHDVAPGEAVAVDVAWDAKLPTIVERTGYLGSFHMVGQWFPKIARVEPSGRPAHFPFHHLAEFYADFGTYDVTLDVPAPFLLGATGPIVESRIEAGRRIERHVQSDIHDFAWTAWDKWQQGSETIDGVAVRILYPPGFRVDAHRELGIMRFALPHFRQKYGRYPYGVLTLVHPPERGSEAGGMEYPTLITTGGPWYGPPGVFIPELVTIHEFGHQYFYGLLASDEVTWPFLDEGLNTYAETEGLGAWKGAGSLVDLGGLTVSDAAGEAALASAAEHDQPVAQPAFAFDTGAAYGDLVYSRTATILETIRRVWGDAAVSRALGRYARRNRFRHPTPDDLQRAFDEVVGARAASALHTALFDKGWVDYVITGLSSRKTVPPAGIFDRNGKRETVAADGAGDGYEGWVLVTRRGTLSFPVEIELTLDDGSVQRVHWDGEGDSTRIPYRGKVALRAAVVDPDHAVLLDDDLTNNHGTVSTGRARGALCTLERAAYWAELVLQAVAP